MVDRHGGGLRLFGVSADLLGEEYYADQCQGDAGETFSVLTVVLAQAISDAHTQLQCQERLGATRSGSPLAMASVTFKS